jgi:hypothetical protein
MRRIRFVSLVLAVFSTSALAQTDSGPTPAGPKHVGLSQYGKLPLSFEANSGQTDGRVKFFSRGNGYSLFLTEDEAVVVLKKDGHGRTGATRQVTSPTRKSNPNESLIGDTIRMQLLGANATARVVGSEELPGKANYFIGNDPSKWRTNVPTYSKVKYEDVYPGIDLSITAIRVSLSTILWFHRARTLVPLDCDSRRSRRWRSMEMEPR